MTSLAAVLPRVIVGYTWPTIVIGILAALWASCGGGETERIAPSGDIETRVEDASGFTRVSASVSFQIELSQAEEFSITVSADNNLMPLVEVEERGGTLHLGLKDPVNIQGNATLRAVITLPTFEGLDLSGATRATLSGFREPAGVEILASGASSVSGELSAGSVTVDLSGASTVSLEGFAFTGDLQASGASRLELIDFELTTASVDVSGASSAEVTVRGEITAAKASGASRILYRGDPTIKGLDVSGASSVSEY